MIINYYYYYYYFYYFGMREFCLQNHKFGGYLKGYFGVLYNKNMENTFKYVKVRFQTSVVSQ